MLTPFLIASGLAALLGLGALRWPAYRVSAAWAALAATGFGASLSLIDAGPLLRYQHYPTPAEALARHPVLVGFLALQTLTVAMAWRRTAGPALKVLLGHTRAWKLVLASAGAFGTAATVSPVVWRYATEVMFAGSLQLVGLATIALAARAWPGSTPEEARSRSIGRWAVPGAAAFALAAAATLAVLAYERHPHVPDEVVYLHHAKYLAAGHLSLPLPPVPEAFDVDLMDVADGRWFSPVPIGWPAALAVGAWAGAPWLVNPVLAGVNVLLAFLVVRSLYGRRTATAAALLLAVSPWFLFLGMSFMTHQFTLTGSLLACLGVARSRETGSAGWALAGGAGVGITSLIRPLDGLIVGGLIAAWALGLGGRRLRLPALATLALGTALTGGVAFPYNKFLTGNPLRFPINQYIDRVYGPDANAYGFGENRGLGWAIDPNPGHSAFDGAVNMNLNLFGLNTDLFGWVGGSLVLLAWFLVAGRWRQEDRVMFTAVLAFPAAYFPYYFSGGPDFGARYWFPIVLPLVVLTIRGIESVEAWAGRRVWVAVTLMSLLALSVFVPWRAADKYRHFRGMRADLRAVATDRGFGADLVLVSGNRHPDYASAFALNPVDLSSPVPVYAWDRDDPTRQKALRAYIGRRVWLVDGPSITGNGFRVSAGPVAAQDLLQGLPR